MHGAELILVPGKYEDSVEMSKKDARAILSPYEYRILMGAIGCSHKDINEINEPLVNYRSYDGDLAFKAVIDSGGTAEGQASFATRQEGTRGKVRYNCGR